MMSNHNNESSIMWQRMTYLIFSFKFTYTAVCPLVVWVIFIMSHHSWVIMTTTRGVQTHTHSTLLDSKTNYRTGFNQFKPVITSSKPWIFTFRTIQRLRPPKLQSDWTWPSFKKYCDRRNTKIKISAILNSFFYAFSYRLVTIKRDLNGFEVK